MQLYLLRHAIAVAQGTPGYPTDDRPLTEDGIKKMKKAAAGLKQCIDEIGLIISSPLKRAYHTAQIAAEALDYGGTIQKSKNLLPGANVNLIIQELTSRAHLKDVMLVGHNPHMERLGAMLIGAQSGAMLMRKGGICRIDISFTPKLRHGTLIWHLTPKQLRTFA